MERSSGHRMGTIFFFPLATFSLLVTTFLYYLKLWLNFKYWPQEIAQSPKHAILFPHMPELPTDYSSKIQWDSDHSLLLLLLALLYELPLFIILVITMACKQVPMIRHQAPFDIFSKQHFKANQIMTLFCINSPSHSHFSYCKSQSL